MVRLVAAIEEWAHEYEEKSVYEFTGGVIKPKVNIGAIRGGFPPQPSETASSCSIFISIRLLPGVGPLSVMREIRQAVNKAGLEAEVSSYFFKKGYIGENVEPIVTAIEESYRELCNENLPGISSEETSMWRDLNIYNEVGIPAVTFGPARYADKLLNGRPGEIKFLLQDDMVKTAKLYALVALKMCSELRD